MRIGHGAPCPMPYRYPFRWDSSQSASAEPAYAAPAVVPDSLEDGQPGAAAPLVDPFHHADALVEGHRVVLVSVEAPDRHLPQRLAVPADSRPADRGDGGEPFRIGHGPQPCAVPPMLKPVRYTRSASIPQAVEQPVQKIV